MTPLEIAALEIKLLGRAGAAALGLADLLDAIASARAELIAALEASPCTRSTTLGYVGEDVVRMASEPGKGEECWRDGAAGWRDKLPHPSDPLEGYCDPCRARAPIAKRLHELRIKKGGAVRAVAETGRALRALRNLAGAP